MKNENKGKRQRKKVRYDQMLKTQVKKKRSPRAPIAIGVALAVCAVLIPVFIFCLQGDGDGKETDYVCISVQDYGDIVLELYPDVAPKTVNNFKKLVSKGFYKNSTFHRIIDDFMIQGGKSASGKKADTITGEFASNGWKNDLLHTRGVISMARSDRPNSASSEFFIVQTEHASWLDGDYAAFGRVISGMDVVDAIAGVDTNASDAPEEPVIILNIRFVEKPESN